MTLRPQAVIFDIGNVLIEWQPERFYDSLMPRAEREACLRKSICTA
jgi:FMN phosphatase YigB (HAD superfamily)